MGENTTNCGSLKSGTTERRGSCINSNQTGSFTYRRKMAEKRCFRDGIKDVIEGFLVYRKSLMQSESTMKALPP